MKAYELMMFLVVFNLMIGILGSLGIFAYGLSTYNFTRAAIEIVIGTALLAFFGAAVLGYFTKSSKSSTLGVAYGLFDTLFWATYIWSLTIIDAILESVEGDFGLKWGLYGIFTVVVGYVFIAGMIQMTSGGWKSYK